MDIIELPEMEDLHKLIDDIYELSLKYGRLKIFLKVKESDTTMRASTDPKYFVNGKVPAQTFIDNTYKIVGIDGDLVEKRIEYEETAALLEKKRAELDLAKLSIDLWRTQSANVRMTSL